MQNHLAPKYQKQRLLLMAAIMAVIVIGSPPAVCTLPVAAGWTASGIPRPPTDQASFLAYLARAGLPAYSRDRRYPANFSTFHNYKLLVYGTPAQVPNNRYSAIYRQYALLGFSYDERPVTNSLFPDDAPGGVSQTSPFRWREIDLGNGALDSWRRLDDARRRTLQSAPLYYRNQDYGGMNFFNLGLNERTAIVLAPPSWNLGSALYTEHYLQRNGYQEKRYATFTCNGSGGAELGCDLEILTPPDADGTYGFAPGQDELRIAYRVTGRINALTGLARDADIVQRGTGTDDGHVLGSGSGPFVYEGVRVVGRSSLVDGATGIAEIKATTFVVSAMGDIILQEQVRYLPLRSRKNIQPLAVQAGLSGAVGFFSGARSLAGKPLAASSLRFLGLETVWLNVTFSKPVAHWEYAFLDATFRIPGEDGRLAYSVPLQMPLNRDTLSWQDTRLQPPVEIRITAADREPHGQGAATCIPGIELTGDIYDLLYLQTAN